MEYRSEMLARIAARENQIPSDTVSFLAHPTAVRSQSNYPDRLCELILELIKSSEANERDLPSGTKQRDLQLGVGFARSLRWIHRFQTDSDDLFLRRVLLKSLMPMYVAAGHGRVGSSLQETLSLLQSACTLFELDRIASDDDLSNWLRNGNPTADPHQSIAKSFRVSLDLVSNGMWNTLRRKYHPSLNNNNSAHAPASPKHHSAWWSLACQLSNHKSQIAIPAEIGAGVIAWDKLLDHWQQVLDAISVEESTADAHNQSSGPTGQMASTASESEQTTSNNRNAPRLPEADGDDKLTRTSPPPAPTKFDFANDHRFVEIRSSKDPQLSTLLDQLLMQSRNDQGLLSLIVVKKLGSESNGKPGTSDIQNWQSNFIRHMDARGESSNVRGFISDEGELSLVFQDVERSELAQWVRDSFARISQIGDNSQLATQVAQPLVAGVATVHAPSRSFRIEQLIQAAWRCLDGATNQGAGAVKTIEVF
jgi:hypothetical protein